jgi:drug/metabolite transporter (DMT)-like permease
LPKEAGMTAVQKAYLALVIATLSWGGNTVAGKFAVGHITPSMLTLSRWILAVALIFAISVPQLKRDWPVLRQHIPLLIGYGAIGFTGFNFFLYSALQYTSAVNAAIEQAGIPMLIFVLNYILFRTRVAAAQIVGFALTLVGVAVTASHGDLMRLVNLTVNFGDGLMLVCVIIYAGYTVALRWKPQLHWKSMMAATAVGALLASIPVAAWEVSRIGVQWPDTRGWGIAVFAGIFPSLVSQILFIKGVEGIGPNRAGLFINMIPAFATILSIAILGERLELFHIVAIVLVLAGIAIAEWRRKQSV